MSQLKLVLFGPQSTRFTARYLEDLRLKIRNNKKFYFFIDIIKELPDLWQSLTDAHPDLGKISGQAQLADLASFLGPEGSPIPDAKSLSNLQLAPLTVLSQLIDFLCLESQNAQDSSPSTIHLPSSLCGAQGLCVGFLPAAVVALAKVGADIIKFSPAAFRIALCVGAAVDLDELNQTSVSERSLSLAIRWTGSSGQTSLEEILKQYQGSYISCFTGVDTATITVAARDINELTKKISRHGLRHIQLDLNGRFHSSVHSDVVKSIRRLCAHDVRFRLPSADDLCLPLRSPIDGSLINQGELHHVALEAILLRPSQWSQTVKYAAAKVRSGYTFVPIGTDGFIPHLNHLNSEVWPTTEVEEPSKMSSAFRNTIHACDKLATNTKPPEVVKSSDIAIVGMACRFPRAQSIEALWRLLERGENALQGVPKNRFTVESLTRGPKSTFRGNFLQDPESFDHRFFSISGREAKSMDPQQRLLLQVAYEAMQSAGHVAGEFVENLTDVGCYVGVGAVDYERNVGIHDATAFSALGTLRAFISGRISHFFGWSGPSITYDTACSSSAVAIHAACKAIETKECSMAIAGGVNVITAPELYQNLAAASFLSPSGGSSAFDSNADGYCRGEGAGMVVLMPLELAIASGKHVLGVIRGTAVNQGSNLTPITVPVSQSQISLYHKTLCLSGTASKDVSYVEAHGTGTTVGDPIECESIRKFFGGKDRQHPLFIGSIKDNIGHAEAAAGVAGLIKTVLMMQHRKIPKQANFNSLNPQIPPLGPDKMAIATKMEPWTASKLIALVNSYGAAGSNAAILLHEYTPSQHPRYLQYRTDKPHAVPVILTAKTLYSLETSMKNLTTYVDGIMDSKKPQLLQSIAYNVVNSQRLDFQYQWSTTTSSLEDFSSQLRQATKISDTAPKPTRASIPVVLCFGGQNGNTIRLSKSLFDTTSVLRNYLELCDGTCRQIGLPGIFPGIFESTPVADIVNFHCILFSIQYSTAMAWIDCGLKVSTLIGHSFGQLTALAVAGSLTLIDGLRLVSGRAKLIKSSWGLEKGLMLAMEGSLTDVRDLMRCGRESMEGFRAEIACYNGPKSFVVSGSTNSIEVLEAISTSTSESACFLRSRRLKNAYAFHSALGDDILPAFEALVRSISVKKPLIPIETCSPEQSWVNFDTADIVGHTRYPVYFMDAVERASKRHGQCLWLEAGSGSAVIPMVKKIISSPNTNQHTFQAIDLGCENPLQMLAKVTQRLWKINQLVQFWPFHHSQSQQYEWLPVPPYAFEKTMHWLELKKEISEIDKTLTASADPNLVQMITPEDQTNNTIEFSINCTHPVFQVCARGHAVLGNSLCPASLYMELVVNALHMISKKQSENSVPSIDDLSIKAPLGLGRQDRVFLTLSRGNSSSNSWQFTLTSCLAAQNNNQVLYATGTACLKLASDVTIEDRFRSLQRLLGTFKQQEIRSSSSSDGVSGTAVYRLFSGIVNYADYYHGVKNISAVATEAIAEVVPPPDRPHGLRNSFSNPILLDNFLQAAGIHVNCLSYRRDDEVYMCTKVGELCWSLLYAKKHSENSKWTVYTNFDRITPTVVRNDIYVFDQASGDLALLILRAEFTAVSFKSLSKVLSRVGGLQSDTHKQSILTAESISEKVGPELQLPVDISQSDLSVFTDLAASSMVASEEKMIFTKVQNMFCDLLEIPKDEIHLESSLEELGVDSLITTELLKEIQTLFNTELSNAEIVRMASIKALCQRLSANDLIKTPEYGSDSSAFSKASTLSSDSSISSDDSEPDSSEVNETVRTVYQCFQESKAEFTSAVKKTGFENFYSAVHPQQLALVESYTLDAFSELGCPVLQLSPMQKLPEIKYLDRHRQVVEQLYRILIGAGLIMETENGYVRTYKQREAGATLDLHNSILSKYPRHGSEHKLLRITGERLADCLNGRADPLALLFGSPNARSLLEAVYAEAPMFKSGTIVLMKYILSILKRCDKTRSFRILEIGAGTGGTAKFILDHLAHADAKFEYTFTDISPSMVSAAKKKFRQYSNVEFTVIDIEADPPSTHLGKYDIILSTNCIHATKDLEASSTNIRKMLRQDGVLCLVELTQNLFWFDLVFGLLEGWWRFEDGRQHALASEVVWKERLLAAGFKWIDWTQDSSDESKILRVITASQSEDFLIEHGTFVNEESNVETVVFKEHDGLSLAADIYYPKAHVGRDILLPIALMIHGGGHIMLSRKDIRPKQTEMLLERGFLPVSIDYRLCPETTLLNGPMTDVRDALRWVRDTLPNLNLRRPDIGVDRERVVAVGWSTGGHLAMTLGWTTIEYGEAPPDAILSFYPPTDYEDSFWSSSNIPIGSEQEAYNLDYDVKAGIFDRPITSYNIKTTARVPGGWLEPNDPRSRLALHMNWHGQTVPTLLRGARLFDESAEMPPLEQSEVRSISPLAQIEGGMYSTPTFLLHGSADDLIPIEQLQRTYAKLVEYSIQSDFRVVSGGPHLFDIHRGFANENSVVQAITDAYDFLLQHVQH